MVDAEALLQSTRCSVTAPAGCGKTRLIADAVSRITDGRALVLTHTHAGARVLRSRLQEVGAKPGTYSVATIAGWALRYATAYPGLASLSNFEPTEDADWEAVYSGAGTLLGRAAIRRVLHASYSCVFVDEYQDCTGAQHDLICLLDSIVPCRVLGDPLQGIFGFAGGALSWPGTVEAVFPSLGTLSDPWRWKGRNEKLGRWLLKVRDDLVHGRQVDLRNTALSWSAATSQNQMSAALGLMGQTGSAVVIRKWPQAAHNFARRMSGRFRSMEEIDSKDLLSFADDIDSYTGHHRARRVLDLAESCWTKAGADFKRFRAALENNEDPARTKSKKHRRVADALQAVVVSNAPTVLMEAMKEIEASTTGKLFRDELWREASRALREYESGTSETVRSAAWSVRNRLRGGGRAPDRRVVSRPALIKGLEFDHALIPSIEEFHDAKNPQLGSKDFYVAITRASRSLAILSRLPIVQFPIPSL